MRDRGSQPPRRQPSPGPTGPHARRALRWTRMTDSPTPGDAPPDPAPAPQAPADGVSMADLKAVADLAGTGARLLQAETALSIDALRHATAYGVLAGLLAGGALLSLLLALAFELRILLGRLGCRAGGDGGAAAAAGMGDGSAAGTLARAGRLHPHPGLPR